MVSWKLSADLQIYLNCAHYFVVISKGRDHHHQTKDHHHRDGSHQLGPHVRHRVVMGYASVRSTVPKMK